MCNHKKKRCVCVLTAEYHFSTVLSILVYMLPDGKNSSLVRWRASSSICFWATKKPAFIIIWAPGRPKNRALAFDSDLASSLLPPSQIIRRSKNLGESNDIV
jgi:hypothetical protein